MSFTQILVTATFKKEDGTAAAGRVEFQLSTPLQDSSGNMIRARVPIVAVLDANGAISQSLVATNDPTTQPTGATYTVTEKITTAPARAYPMEIAYNSPGATIDLADAAPVFSTAVFSYALTSHTHAFGSVTVGLLDGAGSAGNLALFYNLDNDLGWWRISANLEGHYGSVAIRGPYPHADLLAYGGDPTGVADITPALVAATAALPATGGEIIAGPGLFRFITQWAPNKKVHLRCAGAISEQLTALAPTTFIKAAAMTVAPITLSGGTAGSTLEGFLLQGEVGNAGHGIEILNTRISLRDVSVQRMGGSGVVIGKGGANNCNLWDLDRVFCRNNVGNGFEIDSSTNDANAGLGRHCDASLNGGDGYHMLTSQNSTFIVPHANANTGRGLYLGPNANRHVFIGDDFNEANGAEDVLINAAALGNLFVHSHTYVAGDFVDNSPSTVVLSSPSAQLIRGVQEIAYAAAITPAGNGPQIVNVGALTGNITINAPSSPTKGRVLEFLFIQDGTGGRTVTWDAGAFRQGWSDAGNTLNRRASIRFVYTNIWTQVGAQRLWS